MPELGPVVSALLASRRHSATRRRTMARDPEDMPAEDDVIGASDEEIVGADDEDFDEDDADSDEEDDTDLEEEV
jgi:hypothetical protein